MTAPLSAVGSIQAWLQAKPAAPTPPAKGVAEQAAPTDQVQLSAAAETVLQEAMETTQVTEQEALAGDPEAKRLVAQWAAAKAARAAAARRSTVHVVA